MNRSYAAPAALFLAAFLFLVARKGSAQLNLDGQVRVRAELRDGQGSPLPRNAKSAFFISQRSRLILAYKTSRLTLGFSIQDVRVWGQDVSTINRTTTPATNGLMVHEAWAELVLSDTAETRQRLSLRLGRQELVYDDQRLLGNLDWLQQGRRHDAAVLRFAKGNYSVHAGLAYNQHRENQAGTLYELVPPGAYGSNTNGGPMYKSFEYLHLSKKHRRGTIALLFFADQFSRYHTEQQENLAVKVWDNGVWTRYTGGMFSELRVDRLNVYASAYYQGGKTPAGQALNAALISASTMYKVHKKISVGPGFDYTSGGRNNAGGSNVFDPLYGTAHKFWGSMDYFYAGSGFGNTGLADLYVKSKVTLSSKATVSGDVHWFSSAGRIPAAGPGNARRKFGTEVDLLCSYSLSETVNIEAGYGYFFATAALASPAVKNVPGSQRHNHWAYISLNVRPGLFRQAR